MKFLTYHIIKNTKNFEQQLKFLLKNYNIRNSDEEKLKKRIFLTIDDGHPSFYYYAFPILKKFKIPAVLFVVTDLIDTNKPFWWDEIKYYLGNKEGHKKVWELKGWRNKDREAYLVKLRNSSGKPILRYKQLTTSQLREMQEEGITIANHSHTHPMFDKCDREELDWEVKSSVHKLKQLGFTPHIFAYPNGNFSLEAEAVLEKYNIKQAFLFDHRINSREYNPLRISRLIVNDTTPMWKFKFILSGWHTKILPLTKSLGKFLKKFPELNH